MRSMWAAPGRRGVYVLSMTARLIVGSLLIAVGLGACSPTEAETLDTDTPPSTTTTILASSTTTAISDTSTTATVPVTTTTADVGVPAEIQSLVEGAVVEWNSGDVGRWRATFAPVASTAFAGEEYPIEILQDGFEFFTVLGDQTTVVGCAPGDSDVGEAVLCEVEATNRFLKHIGRSPLSANFYFIFVDGLIVHYRSTPKGGSAVRDEWITFAAWVAERSPNDAEAMRPFPGDANGANVALTYMDEYFADG